MSGEEFQSSKGQIGKKSRQIVSLAAAFVLLLLVVTPVGSFAPAQAATTTATIRPISDFVDAQGTYCFPPEFFSELPPGAAVVDGCVLFIPTIPNYLGISNQNFDRCASVDYAGIANKWIEKESGGSISLGTTTEGRVIERPIGNGPSVQVTVLLYTHNALTWVQPCGSFATEPLLFGNRAADVLAGAEPALGDSFMKFVFTNPEAGAPLPDIIQLFVERFGDVQYSSFHAQASGDLHEQQLCYSDNNCTDVSEGTPGMATIAQTGIYGGKVFNPNSNVAKGDPAFPAERIELRVVG